MVNFKINASPSRKSLVAIALFFILVFLFGGGSRPDVQSNILVRIVAITFGAYAFVVMSSENFQKIRLPFFLLLAFAVVIALQLVPLPPSVWTAMSGRGMFVEAADLVSIEQPWRPLSLTPDLTINSLLSVLPPMATLLLFANLPRKRWLGLIIIILALVLSSGVLGLVQITTKSSGLYFYRITNADSAVGFFANRNHQAMLLALGLPMLATFATFPASSPTLLRWREWGAFVAAMLIVPLVLVTGSRAGLIMLAVGLLGALAIYLSVPRPKVRRRRKIMRFLGPRAIAIAGTAVMILLIVLTAMFARSSSIQRLGVDRIQQDVRVRSFSPILEMTKEYLPFGAGFGSFADVYKIHEPVANLSPIYLNHAHNDVLEIIFESGLAGAALLAVLIAFWSVRTWVLWLRSDVGDRSVALGRLGSVMCLMIFLASLTDYPLRTPIMAAVFALCVTFICLDQREPPNSEGLGRS